MSTRGRQVTLNRELGLGTAILVVFASMIGTGIFITTGELLGMTHDSGWVLLLWVLGGLVALTGSLAYAELATMMPDVGGEYIYLRNIFGLLPAFLSGWISLLVGFSASIATSALALGDYINKLYAINTSGEEGLAGNWEVKLIGAGVIAFFALVHILGLKSGSIIQNILTVIKIAIVAAFIIFGFIFIDWSQTDRLYTSYLSTGKQAADLPTMGLALLMVMFSFSGWNGATYIAGEIKNPEKNLPRALFWGTVITTLIYLGLNVVFLMAAPGSEVSGEGAIGALAATKLFGAEIGNIFTSAIILILLSSISVQMMIGPRVYYAMSKDNIIFKGLGNISERFRTPWVAILIQMVISMIYVLIGDPSMLMQYMGFALSIFPVLAVIGLFVMRRKQPHRPRPYKVWLYPFLPIFFILLSVGMMIAALLAWSETSLFAIGVTVAGIPVYFIWHWAVRRFGSS